MDAFLGGMAILVDPYIMAMIITGKIGRAHV